jgi:hypothetical protein
MQINLTAIKTLAKPPRLARLAALTFMPPCAIITKTKQCQPHAKHKTVYAMVAKNWWQYKSTTCGK